MYTLWFPIDETPAPWIELAFVKFKEIAPWNQIDVYWNWKTWLCPQPSTKKESRFLNESWLAWNSKICDFWMLGFFGVSFVMHVHVFSIITSHSLFECDLSKSMRGPCRFYFCFYSRINMVGTQDASEFNRKKVIFFEGKKSLIFFFNQLWVLSFVALLPLF
jgi:hypothetical protein